MSRPEALNLVERQAGHSLDIHASMRVQNPGRVELNRAYVILAVHSILLEIS